MALLVTYLRLVYLAVVILSTVVEVVVSLPFRSLYTNQIELNISIQTLIHDSHFRAQKPQQTSKKVLKTFEIERHFEENRTKLEGLLLELIYNEAEKGSSAPKSNF